MPISLETQDFLRLTEGANTLLFVDIEATGLRGDYNSILVVSALPYRNEKAVTMKVGQPGNDRKLVREAKEVLEDHDCWVTYYGKGFDLPMLNTRLLKWGLRPIEKRPHVDLYFTLKSNLLTARRSQAHLLEWLETPETKMTIGADVWNQVLHNFSAAIETLVQRCESDVRGLRGLYEKTKHIIVDIKR